MSEVQQIGTIFRQKRKEMGISVDEVARILRIKNQNIIYLENNVIHLINSNIYLPGLIKSYGKILEIDNRIIKEYIKNSNYKKETIYCLININEDEIQKPDKETMINSILIILIIYIILISFSDFKNDNLLLNKVVINNMQEIKQYDGKN